MLLFVIPYIIIIYSLRKEVDIMNYISVKAASEKWGISERRIQKLCEENRIDGTEKFGRAWMIPKDAEKPVDGRMKTRNKTGGESWNLMKSYNSLGLERT